MADQSSVWYLDSYQTYLKFSLIYFRINAFLKESNEKLFSPHGLGCVSWCLVMFRIWRFPSRTESRVATCVKTHQRMRLELAVLRTVWRNPEVFMLLSSKAQWRDSAVHSGDVAASNCKMIWKFYCSIVSLLPEHRLLVLAWLLYAQSKCNPQPLLWALACMCECVCYSTVYSHVGEVGCSDPLINQKAPHAASRTNHIQCSTDFGLKWPQIFFFFPPWWGLLRIPGSTAGSEVTVQLNSVIAVWDWTRPISLLQNTSASFALSFAKELFKMYFWHEQYFNIRNAFFAN